MSAPPLDSPNCRFAPSRCPQSHPATTSRDKNPSSTAPVPPALPKISPKRSPPDSPEHRCRAGSAQSRALSPAACRDPRRASSSRVALAPEPIAPSLDRARPETAADRSQTALAPSLPANPRDTFARRCIPSPAAESARCRIRPASPPTRYRAARLFARRASPPHPAAVAPAQLFAPRTLRMQTPSRQTSSSTRRHSESVQSSNASIPSFRVLRRKHLSAVAVRACLENSWCASLRWFGPCVRAKAALRLSRLSRGALLYSLSRKRTSPATKRMDASPVSPVTRFYKCWSYAV